MDPLTCVAAASNSAPVDADAAACDSAQMSASVARVSCPPASGVPPPKKRRRWAALAVALTVVPAADGFFAAGGLSCQRSDGLSSSAFVCAREASSRDGPRNPSFDEQRRPRIPSVRSEAAARLTALLAPAGACADNWSSFSKPRELGHRSLLLQRRIASANSPGDQEERESGEQQEELLRKRAAKDRAEAAALAAQAEALSKAEEEARAAVAAALGEFDWIRLDKTGLN
jgi:hypothetical protein